MRLPVLAVGLALTALSHVSRLDGATPPVVVGDPVTVTANRTEVPLAATGSSVTVIEREEIERKRHATVLEVLRTVPGLAVVQTGGPGRTTSVFIRGGGAAHTLVLVDGVRVNSTTSGALDFANLKADEVERIEIVRGPQSTLYGSEAMAGVISITTRRGRGESEVRIDAEAGTDDRRRLRASTSGSAGRVDYSVAVGGLETGGISTASESRGNREEDPASSVDASTRLGLDLGEDGRLDLATTYGDADTDLDGFVFGVGPVDDPNAAQRTRSLGSRLRLEQRLRPWWKQTVMVGVADERLDGKDPDTPENRFAIRGRSTQWSSQSDFTLGGAGVLTVGLQHEEREAENRGVFDGDTRLHSIYVQHQASWRDRLFVTGSLRHDDHSDFGGETTYRLTAAHRFGARGPLLRGSAGTGFRAPSLNELLFPGFGNPELAPETSRGIDLGIEQELAAGRLRLGATVFDTAYRDLIAFDLATFRADNVAEADVQGAEITAAYTPMPSLRLDFAHTYLDTEDRGTGEPLARRPRHRSTLSASFDLGERVDGVATLISVRDRIDSDGAPMDDYARLDLSLGYAWNDRLETYLRTVNLLDEDYEEVPGFTSPGRQASAGLRASF